MWGRRGLELLCCALQKLLVGQGQGLKSGGMQPSAMRPWRGLVWHRFGGRERWDALL